MLRPPQPTNAGALTAIPEARSLAIIPSLIATAMTQPRIHQWGHARRLIQSYASAAPNDFFLQTKIVVVEWSAPKFIVGTGGIVCKTRGVREKFVGLNFSAVVLTTN